MKPLTLNGALATPMYDVFTAKAVNAAPLRAIPARVNLLTRNGPAAPDSMRSAKLALGRPDMVPQRQLDQILWHSVHGSGSSPPTPGQGAEGEGRGAEADD